MEIIFYYIQRDIASPPGFSGINLKYLRSVSIILKHVKFIPYYDLILSHLRHIENHNMNVPVAVIENEPAEDPFVLLPPPPPCPNRPARDSSQPRRQNPRSSGMYRSSGNDDDEECNPVHTAKISLSLLRTAKVIETSSNALNEFLIEKKKCSGEGEVEFTVDLREDIRFLSLGASIVFPPQFPQWARKLIHNRTIRNHIELSELYEYDLEFEYGPDGADSEYWGYRGEPYPTPIHITELRRGDILDCITIIMNVPDPERFRHNEIFPLEVVYCARKFDESDEEEAIKEAETALRCRAYPGFTDPHWRNRWVRTSSPDSTPPDNN